MMYDLDSFTVTPEAQRRMDEHGITLTEVLRTVSRHRPTNEVDDTDVAWVIAMREATDLQREGDARIRRAAHLRATATPLLDAPINTDPDIPRAF